MWSRESAAPRDRRVRQAGQARLGPAPRGLAGQARLGKLLRIDSTAASEAPARAGAGRGGAAPSPSLNVTRGGGVPCPPLGRGGVIGRCFTGGPSAGGSPGESARAPAGCAPPSPAELAGDVVPLEPLLAATAPLPPLTLTPPLALAPPPPPPPPLPPWCQWRVPWRLWRPWWPWRPSPASSSDENENSCAWWLSSASGSSAASIAVFSLHAAPRASRLASAAAAAAAAAATAAAATGCLLRSQLAGGAALGAGTGRAAPHSCPQAPRSARVSPGSARGRDQPLRAARPASCAQTLCAKTHRRTAAPTGRRARSLGGARGARCHLGEELLALLLARGGERAVALHVRGERRDARLARGARGEERVAECHEVAHLRRARGKINR